MQVDLIKTIISKGLYSVSTDGVITSGIRSKPVLKPTANKITGYGEISLRYENKTFKEYVHRVVAAIYCEGYESGFVVNHKNGIRTDNRAENLEWVSNQANLIHAKEVLGSQVLHLDQDGERNRMAKLKESDIHEIRSMRKSGALQREIAARFNVAANHISRILSNKRWCHLTSAA